MRLGIKIISIQAIIGTSLILFAFGYYLPQFIENITVIQIGISGGFINALCLIEYMIYDILTYNPRS